MTKQRKTILDIVKKNRKHLTAAQVYKKATKELPNIGVGTVYRNLNILADDGDIRRIFVLDEPVRFDGFTEPHQHLICVQCGKVADVELEGFSLPEEFNQDGFSVSAYEFSAFGICGRCQKKKKEIK